MNDPSQGKINFHTLKTVFSALKTSWVPFSMGTLALFVGAMSGVSTAAVSGKLVDRIVTLTETHSSLLHYSSDPQVQMSLFLGFICVLFLYLGNRFGRLWMNQSLVEALLSVHQVATSKILGAPLEFHFEERSGKLLSRFSHDFSQASLVLERVVAVFIYASFAAILSAVFLVVIKPNMLVLGAPFFLLLYYVSRSISAKSRDKQRIANDAMSNTIGMLTEAVDSGAVLRLQGKEEAFIHQQQNFVSYYQKAQADVLLMQNKRVFLQGLISLTLVVTAFYILLRSATAGKISLGEVGTSITLLTFVLRNYQLVIELLSTLETGLTSVERLSTLTELKGESNSDGVEDRLNTLLQQSASIPVLEARGLFVRYNSDPFVIRNLNFSLKPGERMAFLGRTGAGKSTLVQAIFRLVSFSRGMIFFEGQDISDFSLQELRRHIAIVPQESMLFLGTLRENLILGHPDPASVTDNEMIATLSQVQMQKWYEQKSEGLNTQIRERGLNLSAGEKQLLCLARALLRKPKILIFDEATSNIDPKTEENLVNVLDSATREQTTLIVTHRLALAERCDTICVLSQGELIESGHPKTLLQNPRSTFSSLKALIHAT